jgi:hypothetical protein
MKNRNNLFGIIAIIAVIGFTMVACPPTPSDEHTQENKEVTTAGRLTITGLNAYNGKKLECFTMGDGKILTACQTAYNSYLYINGNLDHFGPYGSLDLGTITGGQVTLNVFEQSSHNSPYESYTGSDQNVIFYVNIHDSDVSLAIVTVNFIYGVGIGAISQ